MEAEQIGRRRNTLSSVKEHKIKYEKPLFKEQVGMIFPQQILERVNNGRFCTYCSGCHGCR